LAGSLEDSLTGGSSPFHRFRTVILTERHIVVSERRPGVHVVTQAMQGQSQLTAVLVDPLPDLRMLVDRNAGGDEERDGEEDACKGLTFRR
jgi:hypothetical protein